MRYYYTDPIAVIWMAKHHGMKFELHGIHAMKDGTVWTWDRDDIVPLLGWDSGDVFERDGDIRFYVHADSMNLLEPKPFDLLCGSFPFGPLNYYLYVEEKYKGHATQIVKEDLENFEFDSIITRKGIAFIWPQR